MWQLIRANDDWEVPIARRMHIDAPITPNAI